jgi:hypothetical protein
MNAREALLGAKSRTEQVYVKSLDRTFIVRGMTGRERDAFELGLVKRTGKKVEYAPQNIRARLVAFCCVNEDGSRVFSDDDVEALGNAPADVLDPLYSSAQKLCGIREEDADELGLGSTPKDSSSPSLPSASVFT